MQLTAKHATALCVFVHLLKTEIFSLRCVVHVSPHGPAFNKFTENSFHTFFFFEMQVISATIVATSMSVAVENKLTEYLSFLFSALVPNEGERETKLCP